MPAREEDTKSIGDTVPRPRLPASLSPFRYPMFRAIWLATLMSNLGVWISLGAAWLMTSITDSAPMVALVQSATALPVLLFSLFGGALADLWDRRLVFMTGQIIVLSGATLIAVLQGVGAVTPWLLLALVFVLDSGSGVASARISGNGRRSGSTIGTADGGGAQQHRLQHRAFGRPRHRRAGCCRLRGAGVFHSQRRLQCLHHPRPADVAAQRPVEELPREHLLPAMASGLRYVGGSPTVLTVMLRCFVFTGLAGAVWALLPLVARQDLGGGPSTYGVLLTSLGIGAIIGALNIGTLRRHTSSQVMVAIGTSCFAVATLVLGLMQNLYAVVPALVLGGAAWMTTLSSFNVMVQLSAANWVKARVLSIYQMSLFGGLALGSWGWGHAAEAIGTGQALTIAGACLLGSLALGLRFRLPANIAPDLSPITALPAPRWRPASMPGLDRSR